ncbi:MAG: fibronectin type III domain-containing protein [Chitinispirillia bacterium]|nr:fibronectin type III domain-containing protein [Chitinispirillia bacterium]
MFTDISRIDNSKTACGSWRKPIFTALAAILIIAGGALAQTPFTWGAAGGPALHSADNAAANRGDDVSYIVHVLREGADNINPAVLRFNNVAVTDAQRDIIRTAASGMLALSPNWTGSSNRALRVWTDLSADVEGASGSVEELDFITTANQTAGAMIGPTANLNPIEINIPMRFLYLPAEGGQPEKFASAIYVLTTLSSTSATLTSAITDPPVENNDGLFRRDVLNAINHAVLTMTAPPPFATNISLNYGATESEMGFTWWTPKDSAAESVLQLVPAAQLAGGQMPANPTTFTGDHETMGETVPFPIPSSLPAYAFDVNRVMVTELIPNTEYAYRVGDGTDGNWSEIFTFRTFNPSTGHTAIVIGDPQISSGALTRMRNAWAHTLASAAARADDASFIISAGDNTAYANDVVEMEAYLFPSELRSLPVFTTVGNHDAIDQRGGAGYQPNLGLLSLVYNWPNHDWMGGSPTASGGTNDQRRGGGNHYFSHGNTLYISLNSLITPTLATLNMHRAFIEEAVASHPGAVWKIVNFHHDIFGSGSGHSAGMVASGRQDLAAILNEFGIDFVINGHEHTHSRSLFMNGTAVVQEQRPVDFAGNVREKLVFEPHPGTFVAPDGIVYMTLGSAADFPKYTSVIPHHPWVAYTDPEEYDDYAQYSIMKIDGNSLTFETYVIPYNPATRLPTDEPEVMHSSITLRKTAVFSDLQELITGAKTLQKGDITDLTWDAFQAALTSAEQIASSAAGEAVHSAFMDIYDKYYELEAQTDKQALAALVEEAAAVLETAVEGLWYGQYPAGSIAVLRAVFDAAAEVNALRLSTQADIDEQYGLLRAAFDAFLADISVIPRPWIDIHEIPASGVYTMGLVDWMDESVRLNTHWTHMNYWPRYFAHNTKYSFAGGTFAQNYTTFAEGSAPNGPRTETPFAPANAMGGRRPGAAEAASHITRTHAGEWIRYELNAARSGEYRVRLGAINPQGSPMEVRLRDLNHNTLAAFNIPANHGTAGEWESAPMISANRNIYLPRGKFIIEMVFMNDGVSPGHIGSGIPAVYANGPNVDILTFERVGAGLPPAFNRPDNIFILPVLPNDAAGNVLRQRGWGTNGVSGEWGAITGSPLTPNEIRSATHIVFEVAARPAGNVDVVLAGNAPGLGDWNQQTYNSMGASATGHNAVYNADLKTYTIDLRLHPAYELWRNTTHIGRIIVSHNSDGWEELNVITAYLVLDETYVPVSVLTNDRVVPAGRGNSKDTAQINSPDVLTGGFFVGPNPVNRFDGAVNFYRQGKRINDGVLTIYDASGNVVSRILISDRGSGAEARRVAGSWDLTDRRGRPVADGTYLIRGTLTASDGSRERVSALIGVR